MKRINHLLCDGCQKQITHEGTDGEIYHDIHFWIKRSNFNFIVDKNGNLETNDENEKMGRVFCDTCFLIILNESPCLGKHFFSKEKDMFIY